MKNLWNREAVTGHNGTVKVGKCLEMAAERRQGEISAANFLNRVLFVTQRNEI